MRIFFKTALLSVLMLIFAGTLNAQVENLLKSALPVLYGDLALTQGKEYNPSEKQVYRDLYYDLQKAGQDVENLERGILSEDIVQIFDFKELKTIKKDDLKIDSLKQIIIEKQIAINDHLKWTEKLAADTLGAAVLYVSYKDLYTAKKYDDAYVKWQQLFYKYPLISSSVYKVGAVLMKMKISAAQDSVEKQKYIDSLFIVYDQQMRVYPQKEGYVYGRKTIDFYNFYIKGQDLNDSLVRLELHKNFALSNKAIELTKEKTASYVFPTAMKLTYFEYLLDSISAEEALNNYLYYTDVLTQQYEEQDDAATKEKIKTYGINGVDQVFTQSDLSTCEYLIPTFQKKFDAAPDDPKNLKKILTTLGQKGCADSMLYSDVAIALYDIEPNAIYAHTIALIFASREKYEQSLGYFDEAISLEEVDSLKAKYNFEAAKVLNKQRKYSEARQYARKAIELKPDCGKAYILIATMYASTASSVGSDAFEHQAVFWAAVDKLIQAKNADPSVAETANTLISTYSANYPTKESGFMRTSSDPVYEGDSYSVGGWIGEVTTARYLK